MIGYFIKMAQNNAWANGVLYEACCGLTEAQVWADRSGFFGSVGATLNHIYQVDLYYLDALEAGGRGRSVYQRGAERDLATLRGLQAASDARLIEFCEGLPSETLTQMRDTVRKHGIVSERVDWLVLHLVQHEIHHRGQVHGMLSHAGVAPPQLDDFYLEDGRVATARPYWE
jgi:uncharacterized damage-inducible protein DinB